MNDVNITINIDLSAMKRAFLGALRPRRLPKTLLVLALFAGMAYAATEPLAIQYAFRDGDAIVASEINKNFDDLFAKVNVILGDTPGEGVEWLRSETTRIRAEISDTITTNENRTEDLDVGSGNLTNVIMIWSGNYTDTPKPDNWNYYTAAMDKFIVGAGGSYTRNTSSPGTSHYHDIDHTHSVTKSGILSGGGHSHIIFTLLKYLAGSPYGLPEEPWNWEVFKFDSTSYVIGNDGINDLWYSADGYHLGTGSSFIPLAIDVSDPNRIFSDTSVDYESFYTANGGGHTHGIGSYTLSDGKGYKNSGIVENTASNIAADKNIPPYYALSFIKSN